MPRTAEILKLFDIAVLKVVRNLDYWITDFREDVEYRDIIGPFEYLPPKFVEIILKTAIEKNRLKKIHLQVLIDGRIRVLDLSRCSAVANNNVVGRMIGYRCVHLKDMNLSGLSRINAEVLISILQSLPELEVLNLSRTCCNDQVLLTLSRTARYLSKLDISQNKYVSDTGVSYLCKCRLNPNRAWYPPLVRIILLDTCVTIMGVQMLLESRQLEYIGHPDLVTCLQDMHSDYVPDTCVDEKQLYSLTNASYIADISSDTPVMHALETYVTFCPLVTEVTLVGCQDMLTANHYLVLASLNNIQKLHFCLIVEPSIFQAGLMPLLETRGPGLKELRLEDVNMVNVEVLAHCCPNLDLFYNGYSGYNLCYFDSRPAEELLDKPRERSDMKPFAKLKHLHISACDMGTSLQVETQSRMLRILLAHASQLRSLDLQHLQGLTDAVLYQVFSTNLLSELIQLTLVECNAVTGEGIDKLLTQPNPLKDVRLLNCAEISRKYVEDIKKMSENNKWELHMVWT